MQYLSFKKSIATLSLALAFVGCVSSNKETPLPQWYHVAPINTAQFLYGEGEGTSLEEAKKNALNTMASGLVVSISSTMQTSTKSTTGTSGSSYSKDVSKDVKLEVQKIKFTNAVVKNSEMIGGKFYILMQVNRQELFAQQKGEFDSKDSRADELFSSLEGKAKLDQIHILQDMYPLLKETKAQTIILNAINNTFPYATYTKKYDSYIDKLDDIKNSCVINVATNQNKDLSIENKMVNQNKDLSIENKMVNQNEKYFSDNLIDLLNQNKFKISNNTSNSDISIQLTTFPKYSIASGWNIAKVSTTLSVISNGKVVSNKIISTIGRSSTSKESALEDASKKFREEILKQTLDSVIFSK